MVNLAVTHPKVSARASYHWSLAPPDEAWCRLTWHVKV